MNQTYQGSCHCRCGQIAFEVEGELTGTTDCNYAFCPTCGMHPFGEAVGPDGNPMAAVNVRCLEGVDIYDIPVHHYDGRAMCVGRSRWRGCRRPYVTKSST